MQSTLYISKLDGQPFCDIRVVVKACVRDRTTTELQPRRRGKEAPLIEKLRDNKIWKEGQRERGAHDLQARLDDNGGEENTNSHIEVCH